MPEPESSLCSCDGTPPPPPLWAPSRSGVGVRGGGVPSPSCPFFSTEAALCDHILLIRELGQSPQLGSERAHSYPPPPPRPAQFSERPKLESLTRLVDGFTDDFIDQILTNELYRVYFYKCPSRAFSLLLQCSISVWVGGLESARTSPRIISCPVYLHVSALAQTTE